MVFRVPTERVSERGPSAHKSGIFLTFKADVGVWYRALFDGVRASGIECLVCGSCRMFNFRGFGGCQCRCRLRHVQNNPKFEKCRLGECLAMVVCSRPLYRQTIFHVQLSGPKNQPRRTRSGSSSTAMLCRILAGIVLAVWMVQGLGS